MINNTFYAPLHEITPLTLAVIAQKDEEGNSYTSVLEEETEYVVEHSPSKLIDYACKFFGASLKGRQDGTRNICGITHKAPISIDPSSGMYFFPTTSPTNSKCSWIAHSHIDQVNRAVNQCTEIVFKTGRTITLDTSYGSVMNQIHRTAQFRYLLDNRIKHLQQ
ncbi:competence protein ComK [Ornithinibacillus xuwenensis]|uniref:Competence protein ComK n=1 Tax=Ornithinibacillus xuwenensis TaxID=3144668 RepID=A0ABU9XJL9_9BACI